MQTKAIYTTWEYGKGQEKLTYNKTLFSQNDQVPQLKVQLAGASEVTVSGRATFVMPDGSTVSTLHISNTNNMLVFNIPPVALIQIGEHSITVEASTDTFNFTIPIPIKYVVNSSANIDCSSAIPPSDITYVTDILNTLQQQINVARDMLDEVNTTINTAKEIADGLVLKIVETGDSQQARLEEFTQAKIKEINDEGLKLEIAQNAHGFILNAVQYDKASGVYTKANVETGADALAVRIDDNKFYLVTNGFVEIPANAVDSKGNPYELDEYYFLDNEVAGGCTPEKPIHIFQALFCVVNKKGVKSALVEIGDPIDLNPRILVDEINALGLATTDQVVLSEPTIADLIASKKYKVGDVVQVLGYYSAGDGGGHPRIKKPEGYNGADAVIGADGSIWGIVHSGEVNVSWFGAKGDGATDDSLKIQNAIDFFYNHNSTGVVLLSNKKYVVSSTLVLYPNILLKGLLTGSYFKGGGWERGSTLYPLANFTGTEIIRIAPEDVNSTLSNTYGVAVQNVSFDFNLVKNVGINGLVIKSASNCPNFENLRFINNNKGTNLYIGYSKNTNAYLPDGLCFYNIVTLPADNGIDTTVPLVHIESANETVFRDCKFQHSNTPLKTVGCASVKIEGGAGLKIATITFDNCSFTGSEIGLLLASNDSNSLGLRWIRVTNCHFEGNNRGIVMRGTSSRPIQFCQIERNNRFITQTESEIVLESQVKNNYIGGDEATRIKINNTCENNTIEGIINVTDNGKNNSVTYRVNDMLFDKNYIEDWKTVPLTFGWTDTTPTRNKFGFCKNFNTRKVMLKGYLTGGGVGGDNVAFTLPKGYRPVQNLELVALGNLTGETSYIVIKTNGECIVYKTTDRICIDGVEFNIF